MPTPILILAGPTASGKSALALAIAEKTQGVILNADSQQMYAELRILSARPTPEDEARAPHCLYGALPASEPCSAGKWLKLARMEIDWALAQHRPVIVVGGTGLYMKTLLQGIAEIPDIPPEVRTQARADLTAMGHAAFHERLAAVDPELGAKLRPTDTQRLLRAYEVWLGTGKPLSWWHLQGNKPIYDRSLFIIFKVVIERNMLYACCNARFSAMIEQGAIKEVRSLLTLGLPPDLPAMRIIGVPELAAYIRGEWPLDEAVAKAQQATRNYAKRQMTWFRHQLPEGRIITPGQERDVDALLHS